MTSSESTLDLPETRLTVFAFLWAAYTLFHQFDSGWNQSSLVVLMTFAAIALLCRPGKLGLFLLLCFFHVANLLDQ